MKRFLCLLISLLLLLCSCSGGEGGLGIGSVSRPYADESEGESEVLSSAESRSDSWTLTLEKEAKELLVKDALVIDIFANQALASYAEGLEKTGYGYLVSDAYYPLSEECEYSSFERLEALVRSVYTEESGVYRELFEAWPRYGNPVFRCGYNGRTELCYIYDAGFDTDLSGAAVSLLSVEAEGVYRFQYSKGGSIYTFRMVKTDDGFRLANSLLFIDEAMQMAGGGADCLVEDVGSAAELRGKCLWINVLVECPGSEWDNQEDLNGLKAMLDDAEEFILASGRLYGVNDISFDKVYTKLKLKNAPTDYTKGAYWADTAFQDSGYKGIGDYVATISKGISFDNVCVMFHFNLHGRSFCLPFDSTLNEDSKYFYESCMMFYSTPDEGTYFACPSLYVHEFLHAFGAVDIYEGTVTEKGNDLATVYFDKDIMRYEPQDISDCYVGDLTAKLIGWKGTLSPQLKDFLKQMK